MFAELFQEARPDLILNTVSNYILITNQYYDMVDKGSYTDYYLIPLSAISQNELAVIQCESYFDSDYINELNSILSRFEEFKTDKLTIKANIVAVYRK